jgi:hypothetical protein
LRSLCGLSFRIGNLHTEIAKITKTDSDWITLFDSLTLFSLRSLCGLSFLIGILHTEIAKITKTDSDWITLFDSLTLFLCVLCDLRVDRLEGDSYFRG